jgi:O-antigen ligase
MIKWLFKYGAAIFLFNTVLLSIVSTKALGGYIFLVLMGLYAFILLINPKQIRKIIFHQAFSFFLILNIINLSYFLLLHSLSDFEAVKYMLARGIQFSIISFSVYYNFEYFKQYFLNHLSYIILGVVILGLIEDPFIFSARYSGVMWNPNAFSSFTSMAFVALFLKKETKTKFTIFSLVLLFIVSLATGSRDVIAAFSLAYLFKYGFSKRNIWYSVLALAFCFILINLQFETISVSRFSSQSLFNDRLLQYKYAYETLMQKPFFGFGLDKYAFINPELTEENLHGAHNGYLAILVQYGFLFGLLVLSIIFSKSFSFLNKRYLKNSETKFYVYLVTYTLVASAYETLLTGINEFQTILFWLALAFLSFSEFKGKYGDGD